MPVNLSVKNAPDPLVRHLKERAKRNRRSLHGELLAILEEVVRQDERLAPADLLKEVRRLGLRTPGESARMIREDRDAR